MILIAIGGVFGRLAAVRAGAEHAADHRLRALQGIGAGGLLSSSQSVIADIIAPRERGRYQAYFSGIYALATVGGPVVGGLFVDHLSWRWVFWINPPLGIVAFVLCRRALRLLPVPHIRRPHRLSRRRADDRGGNVLAVRPDVGRKAICLDLADS